MKRISFDCVNVAFYMMSTKEIDEAQWVDRKEVEFSKGGISFYGLRQQDLLKIFDIGTFDWALPQDWVDANKGKVQPGNYVWAYPKTGPNKLFGMPYRYTELWDELYRRIMAYIIETDPEDWNSNKMGNVLNLNFAQWVISIE